VSVLSSILQPGGTAGRNDQLQQQKSAASYASQLLGMLFPNLSQDYQYAGNLEPQRQSDIGNMLMQMSPGNINAQEDAYKRNAFSNAQMASNQASAEAQGEGLSPAYSAGNTTAINNAAANASNQYNAQLESPEQQLARGAARLSLYQQGQTSPFAQPFQQQVSNVYGQPQVPVSQGLGGAIGGILGNFLGGGIPGLGSLGSLFGGGSSSSGGGSQGVQQPYQGSGFQNQGYGYGSSGLGSGGNSGFGNSGFGGGSGNFYSGMFGGQLG
jgi:hypothetical protein